MDIHKGKGVVMGGETMRPVSHHFGPWRETRAERHKPTSLGWVFERADRGVWWVLLRKRHKGGGGQDQVQRGERSKCLRQVVPVADQDQDPGLVLGEKPPSPRRTLTTKRQSRPLDQT